MSVDRAPAPSSDREGKCPDPVPAALPKVDPKPPAAESIVHAMSDREEREGERFGVTGDVLDRAAEAAAPVIWETEGKNENPHMFDWDDLPSVNRGLALMDAAEVVKAASPVIAEAGYRAGQADALDKAIGAIHAVMVNLNDTFAYACADSETLWFGDDLPDDCEPLLLKHGWYLLVAIAARKRGKEPVREIREKAEYQAALAALTDTEGRDE